MGLSVRPVHHPIASTTRFSARSLPVIFMGTTHDITSPQPTRLKRIAKGLGYFLSLPTLFLGAALYPFSDNILAAFRNSSQQKVESKMTGAELPWGQFYYDVVSSTLVQHGKELLDDQRVRLPHPLTRDMLENHLTAIAATREQFIKKGIFFKEPHVVLDANTPEGIWRMEPKQLEEADINRFKAMIASIEPWIELLNSYRPLLERDLRLSELFGPLNKASNLLQQPPSRFYIPGNPAGPAGKIIMPD